MRISNNNYQIKLSMKFQLYNVWQASIDAVRCSLLPAAMMGVIGFVSPLYHTTTSSQILTTQVSKLVPFGMIFFWTTFLFMFSLNLVYLVFFKRPGLFSPANVNSLDTLLIQPVGKKQIVCKLKVPLAKEQVMKWQSVNKLYLHEMIFETSDDLQDLHKIVSLSETDRQRLRKVHMF